MKILLVAILSLNWAAGSGPDLQRGFESEGFSIANDLGSLEKTIDLSKGNQIIENCIKNANQTVIK